MGPKSIDSMYFLLLLLLWYLYELIQEPAVTELAKARKTEYLTYGILFFISLSTVLFFVHRKRSFVAKQEIITAFSLKSVREVIDPHKTDLSEIIYGYPFDMLIPQRVIDAGRDVLIPSWPLTWRALPYWVKTFLERWSREKIPNHDRALKLTYKNNTVKFIYYPSDYLNDDLWNYITGLEKEGLKVVKPKVGRPIDAWLMFFIIPFLVLTAIIATFMVVTHLIK